MKKYGHQLDKKEEILALNKVDALGGELSEEIAEELEKSVGKPVYKISAVSGQGVQDLLYKLAERVRAEKSRREMEPAE